MKRHGDRNGHVQKMPTKRNAAAASSHYLNYDQPDTTERQVCLCHVNPYIVNKIQIHINTLSLETPHQLIKGSYPNPPIVHEFRNPPYNVPQRSFRSGDTGTAPNQGQAQDARAGHQTGHWVPEAECQDSKRQEDETTPYL